MSARSEYWLESVSQALDEHGIACTDEQRKALAHDIEGAASVEGDYLGHSCIPHPAMAEAESMKKRAAEESARSDRRADLFRNALARRLGVEPHRIYIANGEVAID